MKKKKERKIPIEFESKATTRSLLLSTTVNFRMEKQNAQLYWENYRIMLENEKLRKKAIELNQENKALMAQLKVRIATGEVIPMNDTRSSGSTADQMKCRKPGDKNV